MIRTLFPRLGTAALVLALAACGGGSQQDDAQETDPAAAPATETAPSTPSTAAPTPAPASTPGDAAAAGGAFLDPNTAPREQLLTVPGFDAALADAVVAGRPYNDMTAVDRVLAGRLNEQQRDQVYGRLWKPIDLNTASKEEILLIPGVGNRMQHEFEEYRPYRNIEQFRREIGKYVDEEEVARLERYVTIRQ
ncbi:MAG TPA: hypothetical protein VHG91_07560 [Longimicrobium sp.]|nr:hypothetical protein [Longimicrobium sp.]